ncbi:Ino80 complex subunit Ies4 [Schizosaccharomyces pombe]
MSETLVLHLKVPTERFREVLSSLKEKQNFTASPSAQPKPQERPFQMKKPRAPYGMGPRAMKRREKAEKEKLGVVNDELAESSKPSSGAATPTRSAPKSSAGLINSGLRALDRSGKPCRRWEKKPISIRSISTIVWKLPLWLGTPDSIPNTPELPVKTTLDSVNEIAAALSTHAESSPMDATSPVDSMPESATGI